MYSPPIRFSRGFFASYSFVCKRNLPYEFYKVQICVNQSNHRKSGKFPVHLSPKFLLQPNPEPPEALHTALHSRVPEISRILNNIPKLRATLYEPPHVHIYMHRIYLSPHTRVLYPDCTHAPRTGAARVRSAKAASVFALLTFAPDYTRIQENPLFQRRAALTATRSSVESSARLLRAYT